MRSLDGKAFSALRGGIKIETLNGSLTEGKITRLFKTPLLSFDCCVPLLLHQVLSSTSQRTVSGAAPPWVRKASGGGCRSLASSSCNLSVVAGFFPKDFIELLW